MRVTLTRSSVSMGDDTDAPHEVVRELPDDMSLAELARWVRENRYLAQISGGRATWTMRCGAEVVAVLAQQWEEPRYLADPAAPLSDFAGTAGAVGVWFRYHEQQSPDGVHAGLAPRP
ncbi:hypothetical protein [Kitasatospora sp. NPDC050543]|uniref:hypothetical protein n=1 Tax=Kitasatospora sp. NPDC050543 TaxID=3364054 RepID=UPI0037A802C8